MVNYGDHDVCFFKKNVIILRKTSVKLTKKLLFCLQRGKVERSRSLHELKKNVCLPRRKAESSGFPHRISFNFMRYEIQAISCVTPTYFLLLPGGMTMRTEHSNSSANEFALTSLIWVVSC